MTPSTTPRKVSTSTLSMNNEIYIESDENNVEFDEEDLSAWGYPPDELWAPLEGAEPPPRPTLQWKLNPYRLQRKVLLTLKKDIHTSLVGDAVRRVRYYCDVLLRE